MTRLSDRLERDLREVAAGARPSPAAWQSILERLEDDAGWEDALVSVPGSSGAKRRIWVAVAAAALIVIAGSIAILTRADDEETISATEPSPTTEFPVQVPAMTSTFASPTYGYSFRFLDRGGLAPATEVWDPANQPIEDRNLDDRFDAVETGLLAYFEGASTTIPDGVSTDAFVDEYVTARAAGGCGVPRSQQAEITIDGRPGRFASCDHSEATVVAGGRLYLFTGPGRNHRDDAWFAAWLATIDLTPETAAVP